MHGQVRNPCNVERADEPTGLLEYHIRDMDGVATRGILGGSSGSFSYVEADDDHGDSGDKDGNDDRNFGPVASGIIAP